MTFVREFFFMAETLGSLLRGGRQRLGLTQLELVEALRRRMGDDAPSRPAYAHIEQERTTWASPELFNALGELLGISPVRLARAAGLQGSDEPSDIPENLLWVVSQLDESGLDMIEGVATLLLREHRKR